MSSLAIRLLPETLRTLAFGGIGGAYAAIGAAFANPSRILYITNTTDVVLTFSLDGVNDHFVVPTGAGLIVDVMTNRSNPGGAFVISQGTVVYVKGAPTSGAVYLSTFYGANG